MQKENLSETHNLNRRSLIKTATIGAVGLGALASCSKAKDKLLNQANISSGNIDKRLIELGITLPEFAHPVANYASYRIVGDMVYISGIGPAPKEGAKLLGKLGKDLSIKEGSFAAERTALNIISQAKVACEGNLDRIAQWVRLTGYVNSSPEFTQQPQVMNGASELLIKVFGDVGMHARAALGMNALPFNIAVEIEASFQLRSLS
jgi:enamine deaminase RidA (YjgF/YER057c/UK114 family)